MKSIDTLKLLCKLGLKSKACNHADVEDAQGWLQTIAAYLDPSMENLDSLRLQWQRNQELANILRKHEIIWEGKYKQEFNWEIGRLRDADFNLNLAKAQAEEVVKGMRQAWIFFKAKRKDYQLAADAIEKAYYLAKGKGSLPSESGS